MKYNDKCRFQLPWMCYWGLTWNILIRLYHLLRNSIFLLQYFVLYHPNYTNQTKCWELIEVKSFTKNSLSLDFYVQILIELRFYFFIYYQKLLNVRKFNLFPFWFDTSVFLSFVFEFLTKKERRKVHFVTGNLLGMDYVSKPVLLKRFVFFPLSIFLSLSSSYSFNLSFRSVLFYFFSLYFFQNINLKYISRSFCHPICLLVCDVCFVLSRLFCLFIIVILDEFCF